MACQGAVVAARLADGGRFDPAQAAGLAKDQNVFLEKNAALRFHVCGACPFRQEDCDFRSANPPPDAEPCGGYILLALLMREGFITAADVVGAADE